MSWATHIQRYLSKWLVQPYRLACELSQYEHFGIRKLWAEEHKIQQSHEWRILSVKTTELLLTNSIDTVGAIKYLDINTWLRVNILRAAKLGLHRSRPLRILDIGCGAGYFLYVCRQWGHDVTGIDQPLEQMNAAESLVYETFPGILQLKVMPLHIDRFKPLSLPCEYDLITAFMISFNRHKQPDEWGVQEWEFFVHDVSQHLSSRGRLVLSFNAHRERFGALRAYDKATRDLFLSLGTIDPAGEVSITDGTPTTSAEKP